jgi:hypothetical protein
MLTSVEATCREQRDQGSQEGIVRADRSETKISDRGNILMFDKDPGLDLHNEPQRRAPTVFDEKIFASFRGIESVIDKRSSPRGESSDLITLTRSLIEACKSIT